MKVLALALMISGPALAQEPSYGLDFQVGNDVDLNQGFYVCSTDNPRDLMVTLMGIKDTTARRARAISGGCPFKISNNSGPIYHIASVAGDACLDSKIVQNTKTCGIEGHQLVVERDGHEVIVFQISLDISFD